MEIVPSKISTREGPVHGESLDAPDSRCIGPNVYGGANRHLMGLGNGIGVNEGNVQGGFVKVIKENGKQEKLIEVEEKNDPPSLIPEKALKVVTASDYSLMTVDSRSRSGSESSEAVSGNARLWQSVKRPRFHENVPLNTDDEMLETPKPKSRGRPPTTGRYVGQARAKAEIARKKREEVAKKAEEELYRDSLVAHYRHDTVLTDSSIAGSADAGSVARKTVADIQKNVTDNVAAIKMVATKSGHLKGTFVRALQDAAVSITEAVEVLSSRTISDETRLLQADNACLQAEMASLRKELAEIKKEMEGLRKQGSTPAPPNVTEELPPASQFPKNSSAGSSKEEICRSVMVQVGEMLNARLASFEDRLLPEKLIRPPLAADKKKGAQAVVPADLIPGHAPGSRQTKMRPEKMRPSAETCPEEEMRPALPPPTSHFRPSPNEGVWEKVERKKKRKKKKKDKAAQRDSPPSQTQHLPQSYAQACSRSQPLKKARQLRSPRSAAVVITLQPGAKEKGATYATVLGEAKKRIALSDLGISAVKFKVAATGGRILEFPGATGALKADTFAQRLREVVDENFVRISRPTKCVDMRVSGLDDSVLSGDVVAAVASIGGCPEGQVRAGEVTRNYSGLGTVWLRCPVAAAKKVVAGGRLLVGWVSASIKLLEERPQRCYRCLQRGHLRDQCTADIDRSDTCYRCGKVGHKAKECSAAPHCSVCATAGRPADHRVDSRACSQPRKPRKKKSGNTDDGPRVSSQSADPSTSAQAEEVPMAVG